MNRTRLAHSVMMGLALMATMAYHVYGQEATNNVEARVPEFSPNDETRFVVESGLKGASTRKTARTFSGKPSRPAISLSRATQGSPAQKQSSMDKETARLEVRSARFAVFETREIVPESGAAVTAKSESRGRILDKPAAVDPWAQMVSPADGSILLPTQTFLWSAGSDVEDYHLWIGSCFECSDVLDEDEGQNLSRTVALPIDGRLIYVTLFSYTGGSWYSIDYQYQASSGQPLPAKMITPVNGTTLTSPQAFSWDGGYSVDEFYLRIGSCKGCDDILDEDEFLNLSRTVNLPVDGRTIYARLFSSIQGTWWYYDYQYRAPSNQNAKAVRVNVVNKLGYPLNIAINGRVVGSVPAYKTAGTTVSLSSLSVGFQVIQPSLNGRALGDAMAGIFSTINHPSGTYNFEVDNRIGTTFYFLPIFANQTAMPLAIEVNGGLEAENRCDCTVPAYTSNVGAGYYLFFSNSNVRLFEAESNYTGRYIFFGEDANGNMAPGGPLTNFVALDSGAIALTITSAP